MRFNFPAIINIKIAFILSLGRRPVAPLRNTNKKYAKRISSLLIHHSNGKSKNIIKRESLSNFKITKLDWLIWRLQWIKNKMKIINIIIPISLLYINIDRTTNLLNQDKLITVYLQNVTASVLNHNSNNLNNRKYLPLLWSNKSPSS
jgi:hypothetical protein